MLDSDLCLDALREAIQMDGNPFEIIGTDATNLLAHRWHSLDRETPAKLWWMANRLHPAIARALSVDAKEYGAAYALAPFRLAKIDDKHLILAAWPAPRMLGPFDWDWLGINHVIAWDPVTDAARVIGDPGAHLIGAFPDAETGTLYGSPRQFFTDWMRARAAFFVRWTESRKGEWAHGAVEKDLVPGMLAVGDLEKVRWQPSQLPSDLLTVGIDAARLNRLILKSARIPRARNNQLRVAA
jgi:hypothetical protein